MAKRKKVPNSIYLPPLLAKFMDERVSTGLFASRSDYIADLIRKDMREDNHKRT